jgi:segregation and condensation protein A
LDLDVASEYLVIAATLIAMKSQSLLPNEDDLVGGEELEGMDEAFLEELRARLKAYEETKKRAQQLLARPQTGIHTYGRASSVRAPFLVSDEVEDEEPNELATLLVRLMKRVGDVGRGVRIRLEPVSVVNTMMKIVDIFRAGFAVTTKQSFLSLVSRCMPAFEARQASEPVAVRSTVIGSFIALLELVRRGVLSVSQTNQDEDIEICAAISFAEGEEPFSLENSSLENSSLGNSADSVEDSQSTETGSADVGAEDKIIDISSYLSQEEDEFADAEVKKVHNG